MDQTKAAVAASAGEQKVKLLPIEKIVPSKTNPRESFDPAEQAKLEASIQQLGVQVPIKVRPQNGHFELVYGERRLRAAKKVGLKEILAIIQDLTDDQVLEIQVVENEQRADLSPIEKAKGYRALLDRKIYDVGGLAERLGLSTSHVYMSLKLLDVTDPVKKALEDGRLTAGHAEKLARLQPDDQKKVLDRIIQPIDVAQGDPEDYGHKAKREKALIPVRALQTLIADEYQADLSKMPWPMKDPDLLKKAGSCEDCPKRSGNCRDLYPEVKNDTTCTDRACFKEKFNTWIDQRVKEIKGQGKKVAVISEEEYNWRLDAVEGREGVKRLGQWHLPGKKKCRNAGIGIIFEGKRRGQEIDICAAEACGVHNPRPVAYSSGSSRSSSPGKSPAQLAREKEAAEKREREQRREEERATALYLAAIQGGPSKLGIEELRKLAYNAYQGDFPESALKVVGLENAGWATARTKFRTMKEPELLRVIRAGTLSDYEQTDKKEVLAACKIWKIDLKKIDRDLKKKWAAEDESRKIAEAALAPRKVLRDTIQGQAETHQVVLEKAAQEVFGPEVKKAGKKFQIGTCGRCGCTIEEPCEKHLDKGLGIVTFILLDRGTNHGLCVECMTSEELAKLNVKASEKAAGGGKSAGPKKKTKRATKKPARAKKASKKKR